MSSQQLHRDSCDIKPATNERDVWNFVDDLTTTILTPTIAQRHLQPGQNIKLTALEIKHQLPKAKSSDQTEFLNKHSVSISNTIGADIIPTDLAEQQQTPVSGSVKQFAHKQAALCLSVFLAKELDAYLSNSPENAERIFDLEDQLQFSRSDILNDDA